MPSPLSYLSNSQSHRTKYINLTQHSVTYFRCELGLLDRGIHRLDLCTVPTRPPCADFLDEDNTVKSSSSCRTRNIADEVPRALFIR